MIYRNAIRCKHCGETIESVSRWDFVTCKCGKVSVDGGHDYLKRCADSPDDYVEMSQVVPDKDDDDE